MRKIAGWIIDEPAIKAWKQTLALERNREVTTSRRVLEVLWERERKGFKPLPVKEREIIFVSWPKVGTHFLVRH